MQAQGKRKLEVFKDFETGCVRPESVSGRTSLMVTLNHEQGAHLFPKGYNQPEEKAVSAGRQKMQQQETEPRGQALPQQPQSQRERRKDIPPVSREQEDRPAGRTS
jgi:hypothetical protein